MAMEPDSQGSAVSDAANGEVKEGRTPLKQLSTPRSKAPPPDTPLRRRRKRIGGKRTVRSCASCRAAHVRCVADRYGIPCERCAKKSWLDCTLMQKQEEKTRITNKATDQHDTVIDLSSSPPDDDELKQIASDTLELMTEAAKPESP
ncbi:hypothetical protein F5Y03DRAFT_387876 [Xylaria venustula]|nr:hypothetical protein F5Y03DRAFT_387876 [Xylaria venustula]